MHKVIAGFIAVGAAASLHAQTTNQVAASREATVQVDFSRSRGPFLHPERYNNLSRANRWVEQRRADVDFFNEQGLHGETYKVWVDAHLLRDPKTGVYNYHSVTDYLNDVSRLSNNLLVVLDTRAMVRDDHATPEQVKPVVKTILLELKRRYPQIKYVEAFNEPDHNLAKVLTPAKLYDYYKPYYQAVNEVNRELKPKVPVQIGGPGFMQFNVEWMPAFLDGYAADRAPDKRLDFVSWHAYGMFPPGTGQASGPRAYHFYKGNPSEVADERARFEAELRKRGLKTTIPAFITETGIYPGPSFDHTDPKPDYLIGAAGVPSLHYWYMESPNIIPFNWVLRHTSEERKDELVTRAGEGKPIPINTFTPYGNTMAMMAKLKDNRVTATSNALKEGKGIYAIATSDKTGAAIMVWNYQHVGNQTYRVKIDMGQLPAALRGKSLRRRMWRIDDKVSNYWANPQTANLQQVSNTVVKSSPRQTVTIDLTPNALQLVQLEPVGGRTSK